MNKAECRNSLVQAAAAIFWVLCGDAGEILPVATDSWKATQVVGAWVTDFYNFCQVHCMLGWQAVAVCLLWAGGMEKVKQ